MTSHPHRRWSDRRRAQGALWGLLTAVISCLLVFLAIHLVVRAMHG